MTHKSILNIALIGTPNTGKSSLFNRLTGLHQKTGNFPGVTVDKKTGVFHLNPKTKAKVTDLPGTYSIYPKSLDERVVLDVLTGYSKELYPDLIVVVLDASNLRRSLFLLTQINDLNIPTVAAVNMTDVAEKAGRMPDVERLSELIGIPIVPVNAAKGKGIEELKAVIVAAVKSTNSEFAKAKDYVNGNTEILQRIKTEFSLKNEYEALIYLRERDVLEVLKGENRQKVQQLIEKYNYIENGECARKEVLDRHKIVSKIIDQTVAVREVKKQKFRADDLLTHRVGGYLIFFLILFIIFQAVFAWATYPMDLIDTGMARLSAGLQGVMSPGPFTELLTEGILPGIGGILIFIPQIAVLFALIALLEESGYMARVMFLTDKVMRRFGMSGRSVVPLFSGLACAVPAVMAARTIENRKQRLITIFVTPFMSCSARLPVYAILIAVAVPVHYVGGFVNLQGLILFGLYILGFLAALISGVVMKKLLKSGERSFFIMELPKYRIPRLRNILLQIIEKVKIFVWSAGKVILAISIVLWVAAAYGPVDDMEKAAAAVTAKYEHKEISAKQFENEMASAKLQASYAGQFGKLIEPVVAPLGFDWKIGIALLASFAAREVFVGTISTIYSIGSEAENSTIKEKLRSEKNAAGEPVYTLAATFSLLIFYVFAMQCMSTLAVVYRETRSLKWPLLQLFYMTGLAYGASFVVYQLLS